MRELTSAQLIDTSSEARPILVMDKRPVKVAALADILRRDGFAVTGATSATDALGHAQAAAHALAIVDQSLYDGAGAAFAAEWSKQAVPSVYMSESGTPERIARAIDAGAEGYFLSPVDPAQLMLGIHVALRRSRERSALAAEVKRLREIVDTNNDVGVAVGLLMAQRGISRQAAFETLRQHARRRRCRLSIVAAEIASLATRLNEIPSVSPAEEKKARYGSPHRSGSSRGTA